MVPRFEPDMTTPIGQTQWHPWARYERGRGHSAQPLQ
jgi:hypothetical protein